MGSTALGRHQDGITVQDHLNGIPDRNRSVFAASDCHEPSVAHHQRRWLAQDSLGEALAEHLVPVERIAARRTKGLSVRSDRR
jgi:hypothetical protein